MRFKRLQPSRNFERADAVIVLICLLAFVLRIYRVGQQSLWDDEVFSLMYARSGFLDIIAVNIKLADPHAPLFYLVLKSWTAFAGFSEVAFRFPSLIFGVLIIPIIYHLGRKLLDPWIGAIAALIMAVNPFHIWFAQEARTYTLSALLTALSVLIMVHILRGRSNLWLWIGYVVIATLSIYSHYYSFLILLFENAIFLLFIVRRRVKVWHWAIAQTMLILPYLPWSSQAARLLLSYPTWKETRSLGKMIYSSFSMFNIGWFIQQGAERWLVATFAFFLFLGLAALLLPKIRADRPLIYFSPVDSLLILAAYLAIPFATTLLYILGGRLFFHQVNSDILSLAPPQSSVSNTFLASPFQERYFIIITPALYLLLSAGLALLRKVSPFLVAVGLIFFVSIGIYASSQYFHSPDYMKPDSRSLVRFVDEHSQQGDVLVSWSAIATPLLTSYYKPRVPFVEIHEQAPEEEIKGELQQVKQKFDRVWFFPYFGEYIRHPAEDWLNQNAYRVNDWWFAKAHLALYAIQKDSPSQVNLAKVNLENKIELAGYQVDPKATESEGTIRVTVKWQALADVERDYKMSLRLVDSKNHIIAQTDRSVGADEKETSVWKKGYKTEDRLAILVPSATLPGLYSLDIGLYDAYTMKHLAVLNEGQAPTSIWAHLDKVEVKKSKVALYPEKIDVPNKSNLQFGDYLRLLGFDLPDGEVISGSQVSISLFWQAITEINFDVFFITEMVDKKGNTVVSSQGSQANERYPTSQWAAGEVVHDFQDIAIPASVPSGTYRLRLRAKSSLTDLQPANGKYADIGSISVKSREHSFELPSVQFSCYEQFGNWAKMLGFDLEMQGNSVKAGQKLKLKLSWQAIETPSKSYKVFVHIIDASGKIRGQHDSIPASGSAPTNGWVRDEVIADIHELEIKPDTPRGDYVIVAGLYDPDTDWRVKTTQGQDHVVLTTIGIE